MRYSVITLLLLSFILSSVCYADVYVIYKTGTNEVASVQDDDSAVLEDGYTKKIIKGKSTADYPLEYSPGYYKFIDNKFVVNVQKISDEENAKIEAQEKAEKEKTDKETAKTKLMNLEFTEDEADVILR